MMPNTEIADLHAQAREALQPACKGNLSSSERLKLFKNFLKEEEEKIRQRHYHGESGLGIAHARAQLQDILMQTIFECAVSEQSINDGKITLVANGGYGRGTLNPGSDIDLLFLVDQASHKIPKELGEEIQQVLYPLWDIGFKVGHSVRSISECISEARRDPPNRTALLDARFLCGNQDLYKKFTEKFHKECVVKDSKIFLEDRRNDINSRYNKYSRTVFLQEPNVKESPGGMRDYHNLLWIVYSRKQTRDLKDLVDEKVLTPRACRELENAFDFLHRVRNALHYHTNQSTDILTLQLQGVLAQAFEYPQESILRKIEAFMRDYYRHTRSIYNHTTSVFQIFEIESEQNLRGSSFYSLSILKKRAKEEKFDGFISRDGLLYAESNSIFKEDKYRLIRAFLHCQERGLRFSPPMRKLTKAHWDDIDHEFRLSREANETFRSILEKKGQVSLTLRRMHRVGFLGRYLPEFGALDCLVQHEFFHRYTADEHTLRCIDQLDKVLDEENPKTEIFRRIFRKVEDPYALYIAIILHDAGRAENVREHIDGSAMLADQLCNRLEIKGQRRTLIMFLVDHHLTLFRYATKKNIEDPHVIKEFSQQMRSQRFLDILLLFTYVDSLGTNEEAWTPWKESLILQLYKSASTVLSDGYRQFSQEFWNDMEPKRLATRKLFDEQDHHLVDEHFQSVPKRYIRYRKPTTLQEHIKTVKIFKEKERNQPGVENFATHWVAHKDRGYSEMIIVSHDQKYLLDKICCAIASQNLNILSADVYTRDDGIVLDIFRVQTENLTHIDSQSAIEKVDSKLAELFTLKEYNGDDLISKKKNFLQDSADPGVRFPTRAFVDNISDEIFTIVEVQAIDRIGLLHDVFSKLSKYGLSTKHARIVTEKGAAIDSFYVLVEETGEKLTDTEVIAQLEKELSADAKSDKDM